MNSQKYMVIVSSPKGGTWPIGTPTQRGFTENGAKIALSTIREAIPAGWKCWIEEVSPIDYLLQSVGHLRK